MKHTDQILGRISDDKVVPSKDDQDKRRKFFDGVATKLQAIQRLQHDPGYQLFLEELKYEESIAIDVLETAEDSKLAKAAGVLLAIRSYRTWVDDKVAELSEVLEAQ